jgi:hypothetical protein
MWLRFYWIWKKRKIILAAKGDHEIWFNPETNQKTTIPHHREIKEGTLQSILRQAQVDVDIFLDI